MAAASMWRLAALQLQTHNRHSTFYLPRDVVYCKIRQVQLACVHGHEYCCKVSCPLKRGLDSQEMVQMLLEGNVDPYRVKVL